jgi:hypothetical protein
LQTFKTVPGKTYTVSFGLAGHKCRQDRPTEIRVSVAGEKKTFKSTLGQELPWNTDWRTETMEFKAKEKTSTLHFQSLEKADIHGCYLDNVRVVEKEEEVAVTPAETADAPQRRSFGF